MARFLNPYLMQMRHAESQAAKWVDALQKQYPSGYWAGDEFITLPTEDTPNENARSENDASPLDEEHPRI